MKLDDILKEGSQTNIKDELAKHSIAIQCDCSGKGLTELENVPKCITDSFECQNNKLTSLKGGPIEVGGNYNCSENLLTSLEFSPKTIHGNFNCSDNKLTTLEHCPSVIKKGFYCGGNKMLKSLKGMPSKIGGDFSCFGNEIDSFEGMASEVGRDISFSYTKLTSLKDIHKIIKKMNGHFNARGCLISSHVLGVLLIEGCKLVRIEGDDKVEQILNKYLPNTEGMAGVLKCQEELFAADLDEYAQL